MSLISRFSPTLIIQHTGETLKRFPLVVLTTIISGILFYLVCQNKNGQPPELNLFLTTILTIPLVVTIVMLKERKIFSQSFVSWALLLIPAAFYFLSPKEDLNSNYFRFAQLFVATHLLAGFAPYLRDKNDATLWEFNKSIFLRFLLSSLYTAVLTGGLFICLGSLKGLFGLPIGGNTFLVTFIFCAFIFHPIHFLNGVPAKFDELHEYPRPLWIFCQNLLAPLIAVFGLILVVYGVTIIATLNWPKGLITLLVSTFSVVGMLAIVLIDPLIRTDRSWFRKFSGYFFVAQVFLAGLMLAAVLRRTSEYGITESRYFVIIVSLWLMLMGVLFVVRKNQSLKIIPMSLFVLTLFTTYGPWSAHSVSLASEKKRLERLLVQYRVLVDGKLNKDHNVIPYKDANDITSIIQYIFSHHGSSVLKTWVSAKGDHSRPRFFEEAGLTDSYNYAQYFSFNKPEIKALPVENYKKLTSFDLMPEKDSRLENDQLSLSLVLGDLIVSKAGKEVLRKTSAEIIRLAGIKAENQYGITRQVIFKNDSPRMMIVLTSGSGDFKAGNDGNFHHLSGMIFY